MRCCGRNTAQHAASIEPGCRGSACLQNREPTLLQRFGVLSLRPFHSRDDISDRACRIQDCRVVALAELSMELNAFVASLRRDSIDVNLSIVGEVFDVDPWLVDRLISQEIGVNP